MTHFGAETLKLFVGYALSLKNRCQLLGNALLSSSILASAFFSASSASGSWPGSGVSSSQLCFLMSNTVSHIIANVSEFRVELIKELLEVLNAGTDSLGRFCRAL